MRRVRAAARLRQAKRHQRLAGNHLWYPGLRQFGPGMVDDDPSDQRVQQLDVGDIEVRVGDLLDNQARRYPVDTQSAEIFRKIARDQSKRSHFLHERAVDNAGFLALLEIRRDLLLREPARGFLYRLLFLGDPEFHRFRRLVIDIPLRHLSFPRHMRATKDG